MLITTTQHKIHNYFIRNIQNLNTQVHRTDEVIHELCGK